jgi:hypothetical protein
MTQPSEHRATATRVVLQLADPVVPAVVNVAPGVGFDCQVSLVAVTVGALESRICGGPCR